MSYGQKSAFDQQMANFYNRVPATFRRLHAKGDLPGSCPDAAEGSPRAWLTSTSSWPLVSVSDKWISPSVKSSVRSAGEESVREVGRGEGVRVGVLGRDRGWLGFFYTKGRRW